VIRRSIRRLFINHKADVVVQATVVKNLLGLQAFFMPENQNRWMSTRFC